MGYNDEFDPHEYAEQLGYVDELTKGDHTEKGVERGKTPSELRMSRRDVLAKGAVGAATVAGLGAVAGSAAAAPAGSEKYSGTLRVITLGVEWPQGAQQAAEKALGVKFNIQAMSSTAQVQKSITDPTSFDIGGLYNYQFFQIWPTGNYAPVDTAKIKAWKDFYPLFTRGKLNPASKTCTYGSGNAPFRSLFVDPTGKSGLPSPAGVPTSNKQIVQWIDEKTGKPVGGKAMPGGVVGPPAHFNMDSMGYNGDEIKKAPTQMSWAELLNSKYKGRVALLADPGILTQDAGNAAQALGLMKFGQIGNMTKGEMDRLFKILTKYKKDGHFRAFWGTFNESVNLMASKEVVIESMWSPAVALLVAQGVNVKYASPKEGFRGWCSATGIPTHVTKDAEKQQAVYDYINWMYEGTLGGLIMRQGYYIANGAKLLDWIKSPAGQAAKFDPAEFDFWYGGKAASKDLPGITGQVGDIKKGQVRDGGSFLSRACKYSSWNSYFTQNNYQVQKVNEFLSA
jgi:putative spermidine/putrescine transport system substrate-binding protein